jgi:hypothetical protein
MGVHENKLRGQNVFGIRSQSCRIKGMGIRDSKSDLRTHFSKSVKFLLYLDIKSFNKALQIISMDIYVIMDMNTTMCIITAISKTF